MDQYPLRNIPDDLWRDVRVRAVEDGVKVRDVILLGLRAYAKRGLAAFPDYKKPTQRKTA